MNVKNSWFVRRDDTSELLHPEGWSFLRVLGTREGNFRFTFGYVSQLILMGIARPPDIL
jgi:hypothetical protein